MRSEISSHDHFWVRKYVAEEITHCGPYDARTRFAEDGCIALVSRRVVAGLLPKALGDLSPNGLSVPLASAKACS
ncbi:MAG: hypothetical protein WBN92_15490 [Terriglobia bacterium]